MHLVGFTIEIYYDARSYKRQIHSEFYTTTAWVSTACIDLSLLRQFHVNFVNNLWSTNSLDINLVNTISDFSTFAMLLSVDSRGDGGTFEQVALLKKLSVKPSVETACRYFCMSRVAPLLNMWHPLSPHFSVYSGVGEVTNTRLFTKLFSEF